MSVMSTFFIILNSCQTCYILYFIKNSRVSVQSFQDQEPIVLPFRWQASTAPMWLLMKREPCIVPSPASTVTRLSRNSTTSQGNLETSLFRTWTCFGLRHLKSHLGIKSHSCSECGDSFVDGTRLKQHRWIHLQHRAYRCDSWKGY